MTLASESADGTVFEITFGPTGIPGPYGEQTTTGGTNPPAGGTNPPAGGTN